MTTEEKLDRIIRAQEILLARLSLIESYSVAYEEVFASIIAGLSNGKMTQKDALEHVHKIVESALKEVTKKTENNVREICGSG